METEQLTRLMADSARPRCGTPLDLAAVRIRGGRMRQVRSWGVAGSAVGVTLVIVGVMIVTGVFAGSADRAGVPRLDQVVNVDHQMSALTAFERQVLDLVPRSFAVDGTVIVPPADDGTIAAPGTVLAPDDLAGAVVPLWVHSYREGAHLGKRRDLPSSLRGRHDDSQLVTDEGPAYLTCTTWQAEDGCAVSVVTPTGDGRFTYDYGLGSPAFLKPGSKMEVFTAADYATGAYRESVIGGFDGTAAARVVFELVGGSTMDAGVALGTVHPGDTLFWGATPEAVAAVVTYDANGQLLDRHRVKPCSPHAGCEVR